MSRPFPSRRRERGKVLLFALLVLLLLLVLGAAYLLRGPLLRAFAEWWIVDEPLEKAQVILVLGGDNMHGDRVTHAVHLYQAGWAPRLMLSGVNYRTDFNDVVLMERQAVALGVPRESLLAVPQPAVSTLEEALFLQRVLAQHNFRKVIIVTSNYHTRRARLIFRALYRRRGVQVIFSAAPDSDFNPQRWWQDRGGQVTMVLELQKMLYSWWELFDPPPAPPAFVCLLTRTAL
ncbi:MAG: YdcF family protein [Candidatus Acidiferrales bacterium]